MLIENPRGGLRGERERERGLGYGKEAPLSSVRRYRKKRPLLDENALNACCPWEKGSRKKVQIIKNYGRSKIPRIPAL